MKISKLNSSNDFDDTNKKSNFSSQEQFIQNIPTDLMSHNKSTLSNVNFSCNTCENDLAETDKLHSNNSMHLYYKGLSKLKAHEALIH